MKHTEQQVLEIRLNYIFNFYTQQELAEKLNITQWELLEKMKNKSFTKNDFDIIENICNKILFKK
jgi:DNA-binding transcriptional regulator LsrR (DeoR family)